MLNRSKLVVFAIILAVLTILFFQNREPLSLKFLCSDTTSEYCLLQTPSISLAVWMAIFMVAGIFSSLILQLLNGAGTSPKSDRKYTSQSSRASQTRTSYRTNSNLREENNFNRPKTRLSDSPQVDTSQVSDWEQRTSEDWEQPNVPNFAKDSDSARQYPNIKSDDTKYSYRLEKDSPSKSRVPQSPNSKTSEGKPWESETRQGYSSKENSNSESPKPPVSKNTEDVYDANYRTLNNVPPPSVPEDIEDEDPDWI